jgi:hypothetical protein
MLLIAIADEEEEEEEEAGMAVLNCITTFFFAFLALPLAVALFWSAFLSTSSKLLFDIARAGVRRKAIYVPVVWKVESRVRRCIQ